MVVQPNCAYIIPPNRDMAFSNGTLQLLEPMPHRAASACPSTSSFIPWHIDQRERAICIVLSGTGSDGAHRACGPSRPKAAWSWCRTRHPPSTTACRAAPSPPAWSISILPPAEMPAQLMAYVPPRPSGFCQATGQHSLPCAGMRSRPAKNLHPAARPDRPRFLAIQAEHHPSSHRAAHGRASGGEHGGVRESFAADAGGGRGAISRPADRRHQFLP
jgi:hypothetical protein